MTSDSDQKENLIWIAVAARPSILQVALSKVKDLVSSIQCSNFLKIALPIPPSRILLDKVTFLPHIL